MLSRVILPLCPVALVAGPMAAQESGSRTLSGEGLSLSQTGTTMMACPDAVMAQERQVLDALAAVWRFDIDESGELLRVGGPAETPLLTARRP